MSIALRPPVSGKAKPLGVAKASYSLVTQASGVLIFFSYRSLRTPQNLECFLKNFPYMFVSPFQFLGGAVDCHSL